MNEDALDFQNKWNTKHSENDTLLNKRTLFELRWVKVIRFNFVWGNKSTTNN